jgi:hypothetical protein
VFARENFRPIQAHTLPVAGCYQGGSFGTRSDFADPVNGSCIFLMQKFAHLPLPPTSMDPPRAFSIRFLDEFTPAPRGTRRVGGTGRPPGRSPVGKRSSVALPLASAGRNFRRTLGAHAKDLVNELTAASGSGIRFELSSRVFRFYAHSFSRTARDLDETGRAFAAGVPRPELRSRGRRHDVKTPAECSSVVRRGAGVRSSFSGGQRVLIFREFL